MLVDVHAHLDFPQFDSDRDEVIRRAEKEKILIVNSGMGSEGMKAALKLAESYENVFTTPGVSPTEFDEGEIENCINLIRENKDRIIGIGEVGLDYYWVKEPEKRRREVENFRGFIELANELDMPLVVHSRDAEGDVIKMLGDCNLPGDCNCPPRAILHCFGGSVEQAKEAVQLGCLISIPANVVYSKQKQKIVREIPLEHLVLETDAPFLAPTPKTRNEPVNLKLSVQKIADIKGIDAGVVEDATTDNAKKFFKLIP